MFKSPISTPRRDVKFDIFLVIDRRKGDHQIVVVFNRPRSEILETKFRYKQSNY